jgi:3-hydroxyacyl-CoA dehydrogenase
LDFLSNIASIKITRQILVLTVNSPPVNALGRLVRQAIADAVSFTESDGSVHGLVIKCEGRTFFAGADIREFNSVPEPPFLPDVINRLEACAKPVVAAIHASALGGGLEVAMGCHFRIAANSARLGLPEVKLGLIPGAGGTQRLPRLVGVMPALEMMLSGAPIDAQQALMFGLLDRAVPVEELEQGGIALAEEAAAGFRAIRPVRSREEKLAEARSRPELISDFVGRNARKFKNLDAPKAIVGALRIGLEKPFDEAVANERSLFLQLRNGPQSKALRHVFFAEREATKIPKLSANVGSTAVESVGVIGAGTMGTGIALNFLLAGLPVIMVESNAAALERGRAVIAKIISRNVETKRIEALQGERALSLLKLSLAYEDLAQADLIVEAAFETMDVKREIFGQLDRVAKAGAILATNTSYLDVNVIAAETSRPEQVVGMHFFSPANIMKLLEIVRTETTSQEVLATTLMLAKKIGKVAVVAGVTHGFIGNRMLAIRRREAERMILEGANPYKIDKLLEDFGMPMGPFRMADLAGLDLGWSPETSSGSTVRERLCELNRRGQKSRAGFYDYDEEGTATASPVVENLIQNFSQEHQIAQQNFSDQDLLTRLLYPMINEGAKILEEGKAYRASDIDVVWINGYGWPAWRGGPMFYADTVGLSRIKSHLDALTVVLGDAYRPSALLSRLAITEASFSSFDEEKTLT